MDVIHKISPSMLKDVWTTNTPFGLVVVWESRYPEDRKDRNRYVVSLDGSLELRILADFERDGFLSGPALQKSEAIARAKTLATLAAATQNPRCTVDPVLNARCRARFFAMARLWGMTETR